jgi:hypothetical protein
MNALIQSNPSTATSPKEQASRLIGVVREIQEAAKQADIKVSEIEGRGWLKNLVASNRDDLVSTAKSQGRINDLFVRLNQEIIALNTLGYVYLTNVIAEFELQVNEGVKGSDGRIHVLSESGQRVAKAAKEMFSAILDTSRSTQEKIDANSEATVALRIETDDLAKSALTQFSLIESLNYTSAALEKRANRLDAVAAEHGQDIRHLYGGIAEAARHTAEQADSNKRALQRLVDRVEGVIVVTKAIDMRTHAIEEAAAKVDYCMQGHAALVERHSTLIGGATESICTIAHAQSEMASRLTFLADSNDVLQKNVLALLTQMARLDADHTAEKFRLKRIMRVISGTMFLLALTSVVLTLRT